MIHVGLDGSDKFTTEKPFCIPTKAYSVPVESTYPQTSLPSVPG